MTHVDCEQKWNETREEPKKAYCVKGCNELKDEVDEQQRPKCQDANDHNFRFCKSKFIQFKRS